MQYIWTAFTKKTAAAEAAHIESHREREEYNGSVLNSANLIVTLKIKQPATA